ncbi:MAG: 5-dehydro-4-deoxy-D-glucuronate isomerase [Lentisphaerae bacterium RIFOXYA12_FULL_48_11]|nr:MAG: 5-dehydro-4-deoxy-D-glucuronate isomerase [Lentisphaerae bacterium RIFOXYA12_FULL_48_11]
MKNIQTADRELYRRMTAEELRGKFLLENIFQAGKAELVYTNVDRAVVGGIVPLAKPLALNVGKEMACDFFCERREAGVINLGDSGTITVDGKEYKLASRECLYIGKGSKDVSFASDSAKSPAMFYLLSYPAHAEYPTTQVGLDKANRIDLGSAKEANRRTIFQYIRLGGVKSCQLVMGFTELHEGSVWNTFPPHTHDRRTEVYCYFDLPKDGVVFHMMGEPSDTRHVIVKEKQVVLSPEYSIHSGVGTGGYRFVWGMGGENQVFDDMDKVDIGSMK